MTNVVEILTRMDGVTEDRFVQASKRGAEVVNAFPSFRKGHAGVKVHGAVRDGAGVVMIGGGDWSRGWGGAVWGHVCCSFRSGPVSDSIELSEGRRGDGFRGDLLFPVVVVMVVMVV